MASSRAVLHWHRRRWYHKPLGLDLLNKSISGRSPLKSHDGGRLEPPACTPLPVCWLLVAACRYSGWEMPLSLPAEHLGHIKRDLQGEKKCLSGIDNQWCRYPQMKMQLITFLPFRAYKDPVLLCCLFLQGRYQKCCLCGHRCRLFWFVGQHQPFRSSEAQHKSAEFCFAFCCHK